MSNEQPVDAVWWQSRFVGQEWADCSEAHWRWVTSCPEEFEGYEARELFARPVGVAVKTPDALLAAVQALEAAGAQLVLDSALVPPALVHAWRDLRLLIRP